MSDEGISFWKGDVLDTIHKSTRISGLLFQKKWDEIILKKKSRELNPFLHTLQSLDT